MAPTPSPSPGPNPPGTNTAPTIQDMINNQNATLQQLMKGGGSTGKLGDSSSIFLGYNKATNQNSLYRTGGATGPLSPGFKAGENTSSYAEVKLAPTTWDSKTLAAFVNEGIMRKAHGFDVGMGMPEILSAWDDLVQAAYGINQSKGPGAEGKWTPMDVLRSYANSANKFGTIRKGDWEYDVATGEKVRYVGPRTKTQTSRQVDLSSAEDVQALTTQILTQALGRAPTAKEVATYKATINGAEKANPTLSTQTQTLNDMGEVTNTSTTNTGGMSAAAKGALVEKGAKQGPEYGKYQSATTYYNALMQMITGGG